MLKQLTQEQWAINHKIERDTKRTDAWLSRQGITAISLQILTDATDVGLLLKVKKNYNCMRTKDQALWQSLWYHAYTLGKPMTEYHKKLFRKMYKRQDRQRQRQ
jgi:hypothetical protein